MIRAGFTGSPLDRADRVRHDPDALAAARADPAARLLPLPAFEPVLANNGRLAWTALADAPAGAELVLLGLDGGAPRFAALIEGAQPPRGRSPMLNAVLDALRPEDAATYAIARSVLDWHARHRFCANCGHATQVVRAGWVRHCPNCGAEHFPRTDPVVIMVAEHDGRALVGRQASWPAGRYSALAGFVEPGASARCATSPASPGRSRRN